MTAGGIVVVSGLLARADGTVLMGLRRPDKLRPNLWELPGGKVEDGETRAAALRREWREELGVDIEIRQSLAADRLDIEISALIYLYRVDLQPAGQKPVCLDHADIQWVAPDEAIRYLPCSPGFYVQYRAIAAAVAAVRSSTV
jgi:8-oxo-dGTP pyrophosphatase MutT (NUDIX family)